MVHPPAPSTHDMGFTRAQAVFGPGRNYVIHGYQS